jgi:acyl-CoA reductase-like NAD-dependent aldehyde dehydrogenase
MANEQVQSKFLPQAPPQATVDALVKRVMDRLGQTPEQTEPPVFASRGVFSDINLAVDAASEAFPVWSRLRLDHRKRIIEKLRSRLRECLQWMSEDAVSETGLGRVDDKIKKNLLVIDKTPGPEILTPEVFTGDDGLALTEYAPFGVLGSITPTTNATETIINNSISILSAGNTVVFNPHPSAKKVCAKTVEVMNQVIISEGGPANCITVLREPTIDSAKALMKHPKIRLLVVTGGPGVVREAMASGKKVIGAGPGNPPVVVDETADLAQAARDIIAGASLDNNIVCIVEKEIIAVDVIAGELSKLLQTFGAYKLSAEQTRRLTSLVVDGKYPNKKFVGKNAGKILAEIGVPAGDELRLIFAEVPENHPFVQVELLMPVIGLVRAPNVHEAINMAKRCEHGYGHTAVMHSRHIDHLHKMAREINTSIFVKNAPSYAGLGMGGEGFTSFTIASPTGEGMTTARNFSRVRRCTLKDHFRIV